MFVFICNQRGRLFGKRFCGLGSGMSNKLKTAKLPVVTSFYAAAIAAEERTDLPVYCIICDADINRVWVAEHAPKSRIIYFAPCGNAMRRLKEYGVPDDSPLTLTYAVGGAGAQAEIAEGVLKSLAPQIRSQRIHLNLVAAHRSEVKQYFDKLLEKYKLAGNDFVRIVYNPDKNAYFKEFNLLMRNTDILWTKPSELSFYCGLGIPIILAPPIGPHEVFNQRWLRDLGAGTHQSEPEYCGEWILDYLSDGRFSQAAWNGFLYARKLGAEKIIEVMTSGTMQREYSPLLR